MTNIDNDIEMKDNSSKDEKKPKLPRNKRRYFNKDLARMMYGGGDDKQPLEESMDLMEQIIVDFIVKMISQAKELADINDRQIREQDLMFLIRKDFNKYQRINDLFNFHDELQKLRKNSNASIDEISKSKQEDIDFF